MKKEQTKKLSIDLLTVRTLATELTQDQLAAARGGEMKGSGSRLASDGCGC